MNIYNKTLPLLIFLLLLPLSFSTTTISIINEGSYYILNLEFYQERGIFQIKSNCTIKDSLLLGNYSNPYLSEFEWLPNTYIVSLGLGEELNISSVLLIYSENYGDDCSIEIVKDGSILIYNNTIKSNRVLKPKSDITVGFSMDEEYFLLPFLLSTLLWIALR